MDERIEAFLKDVLRLEDENSSIVDEGVRRLLAKYESNFANAESDERMKEKAAEACKALCRSRVFQEIPRHKGTPTADHLRLVLKAIERPGRLLH
jgi:hypothetical protein